MTAIQRQCLLFVCVLIFPAARARAQTAVAAGWRDGFVLQSDNGDYRLQIGGLVHMDGRFNLTDEDEQFADTFLMRRARPILQGRIARFFDFQLTPEFSGGTVNLRYAYFEMRLSPAARIRFGKDRVPIGLERLQSASVLLFAERAFPTALVPDRDIGIQVLGDLVGGRISYAAGLFNGVVDGTSADSDANDSKDFAGRLVVRPFATRAGTPLTGFGLALSAAAGRQSTALPSFRTSLQQTFFRYDADAVGAGVRTRVSPQAFYYYRGFGGFVEAVRSAGPVIASGSRYDIAHTAWQAAVSYVLTGEAATERGVRPAKPFDPPAGQWGALQIAARYSQLSVDRDIVTFGLRAESASPGARSFAVGANWYLNPFVKVVFNVERTAFEGGRRPEVALFFRNQLSF